jgi:protein-disulfide isomerase/uncharacterized membrane protein
LLRLGLILLAVVGCIISIVLLQLSVPSKTPATLFGTGVCSPTNAIDCDYVLSSRWAKVGTLPAAALGFAYFAAVAAWFAIVGPPNYRGRRWHWVPLALVSVGLCGSVYFMYLMAFRLPVWCTWCAAAHLVNALIFVLVLASRPGRPAMGDQAIDAQAPHPSSTRALAVIATSAGLILLISAAGSAYRAHMIGRQYLWRYLMVANNVDYVEWRYRQASVRDIPIRSDDPTLGAADAPFTVVTFSDFMCPNCRDFFLEVDWLLEQFPEKLRFVFKHYPLASACNPHAPRNFHYYACEAALAAEAAHAVGTPKQSLGYHRALYGSMLRLDERPYPALAAQLGMDPAPFSAALQDDAGRDRLDEDITLAHELGVETTPTIFLDGRRLLTWKILTLDAEGRLDRAKTVALWERLLEETSKRQNAAASK